MHIPDSGDPCFRRYANCIIVNAQPYERRSSTALAQCKAHCLQSQVGVYSCRSFVYDNVNQVCIGWDRSARVFKHNVHFSDTRISLPIFYNCVSYWVVQCMHISKRPNLDCQTWMISLKNVTVMGDFRSAICSPMSEIKRQQGKLREMAMS